MKNHDGSTSAHPVNDQHTNVDHHIHGQTHYMPIVSPPTPAPSPGPDTLNSNHSQAMNLCHGLSQADMANSRNRLDEIHSFLSTCTPSEILYISQSIAPLLKRDFFRHLPVELSLHILTFIDDPQTLARAACVSRWWNGLIMGIVNESGWRRMCLFWGFPNSDSGSLSDNGEESIDSDSCPSHDEDTDQPPGDLPEVELPRKKTRVRTRKGRAPARTVLESESEPLHSMEPYANLPMDPALEWIAAKKRRELRNKGKGKEAAPASEPNTRRQRFSYREHFIYSYTLSACQYLPLPLRYTNSLPSEQLAPRWSTSTHP